MARVWNISPIFSWKRAFPAEVGLIWPTGKSEIRMAVRQNRKTRQPHLWSSSISIFWTKIIFWCEVSTIYLASGCNEFTSSRQFDPSLFYTVKGFVFLFLGLKNSFLVSFRLASPSLKQGRRGVFKWVCVCSSATCKWFIAEKMLKCE